MLPYKRKSGSDALKRVKVYVGVPYEFAGMELETIEGAHVDNLSMPKYVTLGSVSEKLGAKF